MRDSGLELRQASIFDRRVDSSSKMYFRVTVDLYNKVLKLLTPASYRPPIWNELPGELLMTIRIGHRILNGL